MLKVKNIIKSFNGLKVLDNVSFEYSGEVILGIVGPNGSGKTTLLNIISGNIMPNSGEIFYEGRMLNSYPLHKRASLGIVRTYQDGKVLPFHTIQEHLQLIKNIEKNMTVTNMEALFDKMGLREKVDKPAATLSFGQKKRLEFAMAMARSDAKLFLFDEPTSGVDPGFMEKLKDELRYLKTLGKGIIIVEHNLGVISEVADQIIVLEGGKILVMGSPSDVFQRQDVHDAYLGGKYAS